MTSHKKISAFIGIIIMIIIIAIVVTQNKGSYQADTTSAPKESLNPNASTTTYTLAQVSEHKDKSSCWTTINSGVYDVTTWITQHPGGEQAILGLCGKDGSAAFNDQHGGQRRPENELASFKIGTLAQ